MEKPKIFICYHKEDEKWKDLLVKQLEVLQQYYDYWTDRDIEAGEDWLQKAEEAIHAACVAIFLVSSDSLSPRFILREDVQNLLTRRREGLRFIPVIVKDCGWELLEWLVRLQPRPEDKVPLRMKKPAQVDREFMKIVKEIAEIIKRPASFTPLAGTQSPGERQDRARPEPSPKLTEVERERLRKLVEKDPEFVAKTAYDRMTTSQRTSEPAKDYQQGLGDQSFGESHQTTGGFGAPLLNEKDNAKKTE